MYHAVRRDTHADRLTARMQEPARHLARRAQDESIAARRCVLEQTELAVVDARVYRGFGDIAAYQREMVTRVDRADGTDALHRGLVADMTAQRVTRISRVNDHSSGADNLDRLKYQPRLRISGMNAEKLRHA